VSDPDPAKEGQERFVRFLKAFEGIEAAARKSAEAAIITAEITKKQIEANAKLVEIVNKAIDVNESLFDAIMLPKDGAVAAIDDLIVEVQGLREDLRAAMKANGITSIFGPLLGGPGPRRKR